MEASSIMAEAEESFERAGRIGLAEDALVGEGLLARYVAGENKNRAPVGPGDSFLGEEIERAEEEDADADAEAANADANGGGGGRGFVSPIALHRGAFAEMASMASSPPASLTPDARRRHNSRMMFVDSDDDDDDEHGDAAGGGGGGREKKKYKYARLTTLDAETVSAIVAPPPMLDDAVACSLERRVRRYARALRALPKVELHAHLNGCVRDETLLDCARRREEERDRDRDRERERETETEEANDATKCNSMEDVRAMLRKPDGASRPLARCFELFGAIHDLCTTHETLERVAAEAVVDFARDGVVYVELRTTPKDFPSRGVTKESYVEAVVRGISLGCELANDDEHHKVTWRGVEGGVAPRDKETIVARLILRRVLYTGPHTTALAW